MIYSNIVVEFYDDTELLVDLKLSADVMCSTNSSNVMDVLDIAVPSTITVTHFIVNVVGIGSCLSIDTGTCSSCRRGVVDAKNEVEYLSCLVTVEYSSCPGAGPCC